MIKREISPKAVPDPIKAVMVGVGNFGAFRRKTMRQTGLFDIIAVNDWNRSTSEKAALEEDSSICETYEELLEFECAEAVIISSGGRFHADQMITAIEKGLHVFVEKPLCSTAEDLVKIVEDCRDSEQVIVVGHKALQHENGALTLQNLIRSGDLGETIAFHKTSCHSGGFCIQPGDWRGIPGHNPGGNLYQCGVHGIHETMHHFGPIKRVHSTMRYDLHTTETSDATICTLEFENGVIGTLHAHHLSAYHHTFHVYGTRMNYYRDDRFGDEGSHITLQKRSDTGSYEPREITLMENGQEELGALINFYAAIRNGTPASPSLMDGARAVGVVFAAAESAKTGEWVDLQAFIPSVYAQTKLAH